MANSVCASFNVGFPPLTRFLGSEQMAAPSSAPLPFQPEHFEPVPMPMPTVLSVPVASGPPQAPTLPPLMSFTMPSLLCPNCGTQLDPLPPLGLQAGDASLGSGDATAEVARLQQELEELRQKESATAQRAQEASEKAQDACEKARRLRQAVEAMTAKAVQALGQTPPVALARPPAPHVHRTLSVSSRGRSVGAPPTSWRWKTFRTNLLCPWMSATKPASDSRLRF